MIVRMMAVLDTWWAKLGTGLLAMVALVLLLQPDQHWKLNWSEAVGFAVAFSTWVFATLRGARVAAHPSDQRLFQEFADLVSHDERLFLGRHDFLNEFERGRLAGTARIYREWEGPRYQFIDPKVQAGWAIARAAVEEFYLLIVTYTAPVGRRVEFQTVRTSFGDDVKESERAEARALNSAAENLAVAYDKFEATARRRLMV